MSVVGLRLFVGADVARLGGVAHGGYLELSASKGVRARGREATAPQIVGARPRWRDTGYSGIGCLPSF